MKFEFYIAGLAREQAECLLDIIVAFAEALGLTVGGGFNEDTPLNLPGEYGEQGDQEAGDGEEQA